jgi:hypothetical protein
MPRVVKKVKKRRVEETPAWKLDFLATGIMPDHFETADDFIWCKPHNPLHRETYDAHRDEILKRRKQHRGILPVHIAELEKGR